MVTQAYMSKFLGQLQDAQKHYFNQFKPLKRRNSDDSNKEYYKKFGYQDEEKNSDSEEDEGEENHYEEEGMMAQGRAPYQPGPARGLQTSKSQGHMLRTPYENQNDSKPMERYEYDHPTEKKKKKTQYPIMGPY